jgi:hypothetical protein
MAFTEFTNLAMPYINSTLIFVGGWFLKRIIEDKNSQIETLKTNSESTKELLNSTKVLVDMYDIQKFKEHLDFTVKTLDEKHKVELEKVYKLLPENKNFIEYQIKAIKETGNLKELPKN